jgi:hypothetical protein
MTQEARMKSEARKSVVKELMAAGHPRHVARQLADKAVKQALLNLAAGEAK